MTEIKRGVAEAGGLIAAYDALRDYLQIDGEGIELAMEFELLALESGAL